MSAAILPPVPSVAPALPVAPPPKVPPPQPSSPALAGVIRPRRWTLTEYRALAKAGFLDGMNTILIDGGILVMPNPGTKHDAALTKVNRFLNRVCPPGHYIRSQQSFDVGTDHDPGPDFAVVPGTEDDYDTLAPTTAPLIVEIAASSLSLDTTKKAELYATAGVQEYWVIDLEHRQLLVFRDPQSLPANLGTTAYKTHLTFAPTDSASPLCAPAASVLVSDLLPR